ncbi:MAG: ribosome-associated translation inhibitor RaiA [Clostridia bacterium]|nr:ribosome-associated translation inhibitor RaiA [Clostridia bacterium]
MRIEIINRNYKEDNGQKTKLVEILEKKVDKLDKYFEDEPSAKVKLSTVGTGKYTMEITLFNDGKQIVRTETTSENMFNNIDILIPKLEKQILKYHTRLISKLRKSAKTPTQKVDEPKDSVPESYGKVVKVKNFDISIITVQQAIAELELLDHNFHVFVNAEDNLVSVVYRRNDGDYGLITPQY